MSPGLTPASAVTPLPVPPGVRRDWTAMGLPAGGWLLITDQTRCTACAQPAPRPCTGACSATHDLPVDALVNLGICAHCDPAPCEDACPADAVTHTAQGVVEVDQELCVGCRFCVDACPNDALLYVDPYRTALPPFGLPDYTPEAPTGALPNTVAKCTLCSDRLLEAQMPVCADACPDGAVWVANLDRNTVTNGREIMRLSDLLARRRLQVVPPGPRVVSLM